MSERHRPRPYIRPRWPNAFRYYPLGVTAAFALGLTPVAFVICQVLLTAPPEDLPEPEPSTAD
jgi:hypothetical protein